MTGKLGNVAKVVALFSSREKRHLLVVIFFSVFVALIEAVGIGAILPFMEVATKPSSIRESGYLRTIYDLLGFKSDTSFIIALGIAVLSIIIITNASQALLHYISVRFSNMRRHTLSLRLFSDYLKQQFVFFLNKNSYDFVKNVTGEIGIMINTTLVQFIELITRVIQVAVLMIFLILLNPLVTLIIAASTMSLYALIFLLAKKTLTRLGAERFEFNAARSRIVSETFWGIKEMKLSGSEAEMIAEYSSPSLRLAHNMVASAVISDVPKFALETAAFSAIISFVLYKIIRSGGLLDVAASITLVVYAGYRILPAIQALFRSVAQLRYGTATVQKISAEFATVTNGSALPRSKPSRLPFNRTLELKNIVFLYPNTDAPVIRDLSLTIPANSLIGLAGRTGCGKTTLVDIMMGLLEAQSGSILVDGLGLQQNIIRRWQANIGYVPQNIYLANSSISANIAFGIKENQIDRQAVIRAARLSQLHDFVTEELKEGYATTIGEKGIRLSGGQRQRIGIARALYRDPTVLIMDEATSALDNQTERAVMEAIDTLQGTRTIILIAHRLSTLKKCDIIYLLDRGAIVDSGTYAELSKRNKYFQA